MPSDFLPGCYANLPIRSGESLPGYLLRLAEANGYRGIRGLLSALPDPPDRRLAISLRELRTSEPLLRNLGRMAVGDGQHLLQFFCSRSNEYGSIWHGVLVNHDAWLEPAAQLCPQCLADASILQEEWDLGCVTTCERHGVELLDACPTCSAQISYDRASLMHCHICGTDFRGMATVVASQGMLTVSSDFASMSRFRYRTHVLQPQVGPWSLGFDLFKILSLKLHHWASNTYPKSHLRNLRLPQRLDATRILATARVDNVYELRCLASFVAELLKPLQALPRDAALQQYALEYLTANVSLPREVSAAIVSEATLPVEMLGYQIFSGRPPSMRGVDAAIRFLGIDNLAYAALQDWDVISTPVAGEPYDIDALLAAQRFLKEDLFTLAEQQQIMGVPISIDPPHHLKMMPTWNPRNRTDCRVSLQSVRTVYLQLMERWDRDTSLTAPVRLRDLTMKTDFPAAVVMRAISLIVTGAIQRFDWQAPFTLGDIQVEGAASESILQGALGG